MAARAHACAGDPTGARPPGLIPPGRPAGVRVIFRVLKDVYRHHTRQSHGGGMQPHRSQRGVTFTGGLIM